MPVVAGLTLTTEPTNPPPQTRPDLITRTPEPTRGEPPSATPTPEPASTLVPTLRDVVAADMSDLPDWFADPPDDAHHRAAQAIMAAWHQDRALAAKLTMFRWAIAEISDLEANVLMALAYMTVTAPEMADQLIALPWLADDVVAYESMAVGAMRDMSFTGRASGNELASLPWVLDGINKEETWAIRVIRDATALRGDLGVQILRLPWITDGLTDSEAHFVRQLGTVGAFRDAEWTLQVTRYPWFVDGLNEMERETVASIGFRSGESSEVARAIAGLAWVRDGVSDLEADAIDSLRRIASVDAKRTLEMVTAPWLADDANYQEQQGLLYLSTFSAQDRELARTLLAQWWIIDGLTYHEQTALEKLSYVNSRQRGLSRQLAALLESGVNPSNLAMLRSLGFLATHHRQKLRVLAQTQWMQDGISPEDAAFLATIHAIYKASPNLYEEMVNARFVETGTVSLPLSGNVRLWVFPNAPVRQPAEVVRAMADGATALERLTLNPLPTHDIILAVINRDPDADYQTPWGGVHTNGHIVVPTAGDSAVSARAIYHEIAHYTFNFFPIWLMEGGADFVAAYVKDRTGVQSLADRVGGGDGRVGSNCSSDGIRNLRQLHDQQGFYTDSGVSPCNYVFGEFFLIKLYQTLGENTTSRALRDLKLLIGADERGIPLSGKDIFLAFLNNAAPEDLAATRDLFRRYYGSGLVDANTSVPDDHADTVAAATLIGSGLSVRGNLDHPFDSDYFRPTPRADLTYTVRFTHDRRNDFYLRILPPGEGRYQYLDSLRGGAAGVRATWTPSEPGEHYLIVESVEGTTGPYTLHVAPAVFSADDHGDGVGTTTNIAFGESITASMDNPSDSDHFRFRASAGRWYRVEVENQDFDYSRIVLHDADGSEVHEGFAVYRWGRRRSSVEWETTEPGEYYVVVRSPHGNMGDYTLVVTEFDRARGDHGEVSYDATAPTPGAAVEGVTDHEFERDHFRLSAQAGQTNRLKVDYTFHMGGTLMRKSGNRRASCRCGKWTGREFPTSMAARTSARRRPCLIVQSSDLHTVGPAFAGTCRCLLWEDVLNARASTV